MKMKAFENLDTPLTPPSHRLNEEWIMSYAAGVASAGEEIFVSTYLKLVPEEIETVALASRIGGEMLVGLPLAPMADDAFEKMLEAIDNTQPAVERKLADIADPPVAERQKDQAGPGGWIDRILAGREDQVDWKYLGPRLRKARLWHGPAGESLWLLRARPGATIPTHTHNGAELTLVLKGAYEDPLGRFETGHVEEADESVEHSLKISEESDCICLALTRSPIVLRHWSARLMQKVVGF